MLPMNFTGLITAMITFVAIGLGFVWVIRFEYYVGAHVARWVAVSGVVLVAISAFIPHFWVSTLIGIVGGTTIWGATELPEQAQRVAKGQFPANPQKKGCADDH